jgi:DNA polymerase III alpha subunit
MNIDQFGQTILSEIELFEELYNGNIKSFNNVLIDDLLVAEKFNNSKKINCDQITSLIPISNSEMLLEEFDKTHQRNWFMPENYCSEIIDYLYSCCKNDEQTNRVSEELELFKKHNMLELLCYLKYLVDVMRENNIVWGVGRGSSVSSYILYLIGIHKIDCLKYKLDIKEFLK